MTPIRVTEATDNGKGDTSGSLSWAIKKANTDAGDDTIVLAQNVQIGGVMKPLLNSNIKLTGDDPDTPAIETFTIDGNRHRPLFVKSGTIQIDHLTLTGGMTEAGKAGKGGAGAGMGGALFIYGGDVTIADSAFTKNWAAGGNNGYSSFSSGGGGMGGNSSAGGGGLFGAAIDSDGGFGGDPAYGSGGAGFGGGGGAGDGTTTSGGDGGFGGGGGGSSSSSLSGGNGGFGGGGGYGGISGSLGGYGGGGGSSFTGTPGSAGFGGSDAGAAAAMGGAIFIRTGSLTISKTTFDSNTVESGSSLSTARALGGAIFAMKSTSNPNGNNQGMPSVLPKVVLSEDVVFTGNMVYDKTYGSSSQPGVTPATFSSGTDLYTSDLWGTTISRGSSPTASLPEATPVPNLKPRPKVQAPVQPIVEDTSTENTSSDTGTTSTDTGTTSTDTGTTGTDTENTSTEPSSGDDNIILSDDDPIDRIIPAGAGNDVVQTSDGDDQVNGNAGDDDIDLGDGDDIGFGGQDNDKIKGGLGSNILVGNKGKDKLTGGDDDDNLFGGQGDDILIGSNGDDFLSGDRGNDKVTGGSGVDVFELRSGDGSDVITDFTPGEDKLRVLEVLSQSQVQVYPADRRFAVKSLGHSTLVLPNLNIATTSISFLDNQCIVKSGTQTILELTSVNIKNTAVRFLNNTLTLSFSGLNLAYFDSDYGELVNIVQTFSTDLNKLNIIEALSNTTTRQLGLSDLTIGGNGTDTTISFNGELLATLNGVSSLGVTDFING